MNGINATKIQNNFVQNLKHLLKEHDICYSQLALDIGVVNAVVYNWTRSKNLPSAINLLKLADYFELTVEEMVG